eukprot:CAMPEP_0119326028 /NCGR_PEP_ID=MMETSP1333-20130426/67281_1 /TAXON_ID=418940 /ORGANISM="Scyphosphaera apsteinii, Strain RCC1455" /LENGTH=66 /DNA_ID=CAMNT_0007334201 /DNA_START=310 /DNA_END=510 /DNA_ORIENTATION=-
MTNGNRSGSMKSANVIARKAFTHRGEKLEMSTTVSHPIRRSNSTPSTCSTLIEPHAAPNIAPHEMV